MWKTIIKIFLILQLTLIAGWYVGEDILPFRTETFLGRGLGGWVSNKPLLWSRANFDGYYYAKIAREGYQHLQQAFFPFYPNFIRLIKHLVGDYVLSGILISSLSFLVFMYLFSLLLKSQGEDKSTIKKTLFYIGLFPTSFYFVSVYTESIFLVWVILSFLFGHKEKWLLAGLTAGLASYTRVTGIFMVPALIYQYYQTAAKRDMKTRVKAASETIRHRMNFKSIVSIIKTRFPHVKNLLAISTGCWGLVAYSIYLKRTVGSFLYFVQAQPQFGTGRQVSRLVLIYQVLWRYLKMILTVDIASYTYAIVWFELLITLLFIFLLIYAWLRTNTPHSWIIFSALAFLLPTFTGTFSSMPRYVLTCFPCFLILAKLKLPKYIYLISYLFLFIAATLYLRGFWIA